MRKLFIIAVLLFHASVYSQDTIDFYATGTNFETMYAATYNYSGQSFTNNKIYQIDSVKFLLVKRNNPTGNAYAEIYTHSGVYGTSSVPTGNPLATSNAFDVTTVSGLTVTWYKFTFADSNKITLSSLHYCVIFHYGTGGDVNNYIKLYLNTSGTHSGNGMRALSDIVWSSVVGDRQFYVYGHRTDIDKMNGLPLNHIKSVAGQIESNIKYVAGVVNASIH